MPEQFPELVALMLADARLPTGGHTQSAGLEPAVAAGLGPAEVAAYARDRLRTVVRVEAGTAVVARHLTRTGGDPREVESHWAARTPSPALRTAARIQGRGYLRLAQRIWPAVLDHLPADAPASTGLPRSVVLGVIGAVTGLEAGQVVRLVAYDDAQTVIAASLKLLPVDPVKAAGWLSGLHPDIEALATALGSLTDPHEIPADGAPLVDAHAQKHVTERMRLFHA